ncbi:MAG TPA: sulfite exporter TauE/SafE family protein [Kribbella sp.]|nr:sulfite exporter TauE/SafE family protein [Kribbella sp.]
MLALALPIGLVIGLTLGALGGGGSILTVPALVYLLGQDPRAATTGSLVIVGITALTGAVAHGRSGTVRLGQGLLFGGLGVAGAWFGTKLSTGVAPSILLTAFAVLMLAVAALMVLRQRRADRRGEQVDPSEEPFITFTPRFSCACPRVAKVVLTATAVGLLTGFFGVGGGFAVVPALVLALGFSMPVAVGTSLVVITVNSATALLARAGQAVSVDWVLIGGFASAAILGSLLGGRLAARVRPELLARTFTVLLIVVAIYTAARSVPQLL